ncbi:hypothetical protein [Nannocystis bainbridge]|uniref:RES domain-containing protein n=1 Tax=Nannocystis bainbridge TaxID=2995303 RepID=A0ABT5E9L0_9BACT|nr:hypothetical protein [Nannocystis bainbridge]MDC0722524.1 hypothetical protein [Nannocystis bainbridge]
MPAPRLIVDHVVATDAALVDLRIEMLEHGAFSVRGVTAVELVQETFQCFMRCLEGAVPPDMSDRACAELNGDGPFDLAPDLLAATGAPLPAGVYDLVHAIVPLTAIHHTGLCVNFPGDYGVSYREPDAWGVEVREAGSDRRLGYGRDNPQPTPTVMYRGTIGDLAILLLPLTTAADAARIDHYAQRLTAGARPTALAFGCYANERCAVAVVLDGHHKLAAAAATSAPVGVLMFLSPRLFRSYADCPRYHPRPEISLEAARRNIVGPTHARLAWADELELQRSFRPPWSRE